ncbi:unnamed protein product [Sphagnum compactum]
MAGTKKTKMEGNGEDGTGRRLPHPAKCQDRIAVIKTKLQRLLDLNVEPDIPAVPADSCAPTSHPASAIQQTKSIAQRTPDRN